MRVATLLLLSLVAAPLGRAAPPAPAATAGSSWSPDGSRLVYVRGGLYDGDLYVVGADGGDAARLTTSGHNRDPAVSPDGSRIAYVHVRKYAERADVWIVGAD